MLQYPSTNHGLIMDYLDSLDSSSDLQPIRGKKIVNRFYLILQISKIPFQNSLAK